MRLDTEFIELRLIHLTRLGGIIRDKKHGLLLSDTSDQLVYTEPIGGS